jgi:hypothetical protein
MALLVFSLKNLFDIVSAYQKRNNGSLPALKTAS